MPGPGLLARTSSILSKPARLCRRARASRFAVDDIRHRDEMASVGLPQPSNHFDVFFRCVQAKSIVLANQQAIGAKSLERFCRFGFAGVDAGRDLRHASSASSGLDQIRSSASIWATEAICFNMKSLMSSGTYCVAMTSVDVVSSSSRIAVRIQRRCGNFSPGAILRACQLGRCGLSRPRRAVLSSSFARAASFSYSSTKA